VDEVLRHALAVEDPQAFYDKLRAGAGRPLVHLYATPPPARGEPETPLPPPPELPPVVPS
jgi:hypothetical protein